MARTPDKFYERPGFAELNAEWQRKLRASGFEDLEDDFPVSHKRDLKRTVFMDREVVRRGEQQGLTEHMRRAGRWLHERVWPRRVLKLMWSLYTEGVPRKELCYRMGTAPGHEAWWVGAKIQEERRAMAAWYGEGGDLGDEVERTLLEEELYNNDDFRHVPTRGEGGGEGAE
jgi:hypothetical protein